MPTREFHDANGRFWLVWDVYPTLPERRVRDAGPPKGHRERRRLVGARLHISPRMAGGWLTFESRDGERRRLVPTLDRMSIDEHLNPESTAWMDAPHHPSCGLGEPRRFSYRGRPWLVCEDGSEFGPALLFFGPGVARRVRHYPRDWRTLPEDALYLISCAR